MTFTCGNCGHRFDIACAKQSKQITRAVQTNGEGPWCDACRYLEMAARHIEARGLTMAAGIERWQSGPLARKYHPDGTI